MFHQFQVSWDPQQMKNCIQSQPHPVSSCGCTARRLGYKKGPLDGPKSLPMGPSHSHKVAMLCTLMS